MIMSAEGITLTKQEEQNIYRVQSILDNRKKVEGYTVLNENEVSFIQDMLHAVLFTAEIKN